MKAAASRVVLTGAAGGIGRAAAVALLEAGAAVLLVGRDASRLAALAASLGQGGAMAARIGTCVADLTRADDLQRLADAASAWEANVLVHGAGLPSFGSFESIGAEQLQQRSEERRVGKECRSRWSPYH